jgi:hypothetical protein
MKGKQLAVHLHTPVKQCQNKDARETHRTLHRVKFLTKGFIFRGWQRGNECRKGSKNTMVPLCITYNWEAIVAVENIQEGDNLTSNYICDILD